MRLPRTSTPPHPDLARSRTAVLVLALPLVLGLLIRVQGARASLFGFEGPTCVVGDWCGPAGCPGCGLTRSTALTLQGELGSALSFNWAGPAVVLACLLGLMLHLDIILRVRQRTKTHERLLAWGTRGFTLLLLLAWCHRLLSI